MLMAFVTVLLASLARRTHPFALSLDAVCAVRQRPHREAAINAALAKARAR